MVKKHSQWWMIPASNEQLRIQAQAGWPGAKTQPITMGGRATPFQHQPGQKV